MAGTDADGSDDDKKSGPYLGLITMDKSMPVMDGVEATRAIRSMVGSRVTIVGLTGDALGADLESFKAAGLDSVLGKPASAKEMHRVASRTESTRQLGWRG